MNAYIAYALVTVAVFASPVPQQHPDFSGVWTVVGIMPKPAENATALPASDVTIRQTNARLEISRTAFDMVRTDIQALDGSESTNKSGAMTRVTKAHWEGSTLVVEGKASQVTSQGYAAWTTKEKYWLDARKRLLLESTYTSTEGKVTKSTVEHARKPGSGSE